MCGTMATCGSTRDRRSRTSRSGFRAIGVWLLGAFAVPKELQQRVLLYPEGVVLLNDTGAAILDLCMDAERLSATPVDEFIDLFVI